MPERLQRRFETCRIVPSVERARDPSQLRIGSCLGFGLSSLMFAYPRPEARGVTNVVAVVRL